MLFSSSTKSNRLRYERVIGYYKNTGDRWCYMQDGPIKKYCRDSGFTLYKIYDNLDFLLADLREGDYYIISTMPQISHDYLTLHHFCNIMKQNKCDFEILDLNIEIRYDKKTNADLAFENFAQIMKDNNSPTMKNDELCYFSVRLLDDNGEYHHLNCDTSDELFKYLIRYNVYNM
jgi:hypothetical protein